MIQTPYLLFLGDAPDMLAAKVAIGIRDWRPDNVAGQLRLPGCGADLGLPDLDLAARLEPDDDCSFRAERWKKFRRPEPVQGMGGIVGIKFILRFLRW